MAQAKTKSTTPKSAKLARRRPVAKGAVAQVAALKKSATGLVTRPRGECELRALTVFESLPLQHGTFLVSDDASAPHLRKKEYAVVDVGDLELQSGELYVIQSQGRERRRRIVQATTSMANITGPGAKPSQVWWLADLRGFRKTDERVFDVPVFAGLSDGPYRAEYLRSDLIGRIVGVAFSALGGLIAREAGWENEEAGNAAFDPSEYIDVLLSAGYGPAMCGDMYYEEMPHRSRTEAEEAAVMAVRWKYFEASTALARVKQECIRRGLIDGRRVA